MKVTTILISYEILKIYKFKFKISLKKVTNYYKNLIMIKLTFIDIDTTLASVQRLELCFCNSGQHHVPHL